MSPLPPPSKIVCIGRNYAAHASELGHEVPAEPLIFLKPPSAIVGNGEPIVLPSQSNQVEFEGEIGVVVGTTLRNASPAAAERGIAGLVAANDVTARDLQRTDGQWSRAKGFDTFCPLGEAASDFPRLDSLTLVTRVNGEERQRASSGMMVFPIPVLLAYVSSIMTLQPGDLLLTGTPAGVGRLNSGDTVEIEIDGVSRVANPVFDSKRAGMVAAALGALT